MSANRASTVWIVEPLGRTHDRADFSCGNESLDHYLRNQATQDSRRRVVAPFVLVQPANPKAIIGYYTLSAFGVTLDDLPPDITKKLPSYPVVPVTLLGRLAIDRRYTGQGAGEFLLVDALQRAYRQASQIAAAAVVVDAIDEQAAHFYRHFEFTPFPDKPGRLFIPMKTIVELFAKP